MNPRLEKLRQEREKLAEKLTSLTARLKALDEQILKLENTDIVGIVRENGLTIEPKSIEQIRSEFEKEYGSIYINI